MTCPGKFFYEKLGIVGWPKTLQPALLGTIAAGGPVLLVGEPGSMKTTFIRRLGQLLGLLTRVYDVDKMSVEALLGELNPDYVDYTGKAIDRLSETIALAATKQGVDIEKHKAKLEAIKKIIGRQFINSVTDYKLIGFDEILRGDPATQQSLLLNILQDKQFMSRLVDALMICCTNTGFEELFEFNEALLNRFWMIFQCPSFSSMTDDQQNQFLSSCGHNKDSAVIEHDPEFAKFFTELGNKLNGPTVPQLDSIVKLFLKHLKHPLSVALGSRLSARKLDHMAKVLYIALYTYLITEEVLYKDMKMEELQPLIRDTFLSTIYLEDLSESEINQVKNSFHLAFNHTFNVEELSLRDRLLSVPHFLVNAEDFSRHVGELPPEKYDLAGIHVFAQRLKNECRNNEPLRYILYKWFIGKVDKHEVPLEGDVVEPIRRKLDSMQKKMDNFTKANAQVKLDSKTLDRNFLEKIQQAATDRMFAGSKVDTSIYASLITTINCFDPDMAHSGEEQIQDMYQTFAELKRV